MPLYIGISTHFPNCNTKIRFIRIYLDGIIKSYTFAIVNITNNE